MNGVPIWRDTASAAATLRRGRILLFATDTIPGLHARWDRPAAVLRIRTLKGRSSDRPFLLLAESRTTAIRLGRPGDRRGERYLERCWPGAITAVLLPVGAAGAAAAASLGGGGPRPTIAIRVPEPAALRELIRAAGAALVSTSANRSGEPPCADLAAAWRAWSHRIDGAWDPNDRLTAPADPPSPMPAASAVVDLTGWPPRLVRAGAVLTPPWQDLS
jgi:L-threonylcarbamoyladenylate synthase